MVLQIVQRRPNCGVTAKTKSTWEKGKGCLGYTDSKLPPSGHDLLVRRIIQVALYPCEIL